MVLRVSIGAFTALQVIGVIAIAAGFMALYDMIEHQRMPGTTGIVSSISLFVALVDLASGRLRAAPAAA